MEIFLRKNAQFALKVAIFVLALMQRIALLYKEILLMKIKLIICKYFLFNLNSILIYLMKSIRMLLRPQSRFFRVIPVNNTGKYNFYHKKIIKILFVIKSLNKINL